MRFSTTIKTGFASLLIILFSQSSFSQAETQNPTAPFWKTRGNSGTDTVTNFLGTTDLAYLTFRTNNIRRMTIDTGGRVGIGTTTPSLSGMLEVVNTINTNPNIISTNYGSPNEFWFRRANGNITAPTIVGTGGSLGRIDGRGYDGSTYLQATRIEMLVDSATGSGQMTGRLVFSTAPAGSTPAERLRINRNGLVGIGTTAPATRMDVNGDFAIRQASLTLANGVNDNVAISPFPNGNSYYRITGPTAAYSITGLLASGDGRIVVLQNTTTQTLTIKDQTTSSNLTARIMTGGGDLAIGDSGTVTLIYSNTDNRWQVQSFTNGTLANGTFGNAWNVTGNAGLSAATNFLGTTDNTDVLIKRQNEEALRVYPGGALIGIGNTSTGVVPLAGFGTRLMWAPAKAAFRAGSINGAQWDNANVGSGSAAFGANNTASGVNAFVSGSGNVVSGQNSVAFGNSNTVTATHALVSGNSHNAAGNYSVVLNNTASSTAAATTSVAGGFQSQTQANLSIAIGWADTAKNLASVALGGFSNEAAGDYSFVTGNNNSTTAAQAAAFGQNNIVSGANSLVSGSSNTVSATHSIVGGQANRIFGENNVANGFQNYIETPFGHSIVVGYQDTIRGSSSAAFGFLTKANAFTTFAAGDRVIANGQTSAGFGYQNVANGVSSFVTGNQDTATGNVSAVFGTGNRAASFNEFVAGMYGTQYTAASTTAYNAADRIFNVGNGTAAGTRADAFTILKGGNVGVGTNNPLQRLHVNGTTNGVRIGGLATLGSFITTPSATTDKMLYADANGDVRAMSAGSTGQVLTYTASGPAWSTATSNDWGITGNAGTVDATNFIGTTDNIPFNIRVNNIRSGKIDHLKNNAFWGYSTGRNLTTTALDNTFIGHNAGVSQYSGSTNTAVGSGALSGGAFSTFNDAASNVAVGYKALGDMSRGYRNVAIGSNAMGTTFGGWYDNIAIGDSAGYGIMWYSNIAIGNSALKNADNSAFNIAIGERALYNLTDATAYQTTYNVALGHSALYNTKPSLTTNGIENVAIGNSAMFANTTGYSNAALGSGVLDNNTSGYQNTAIGEDAGGGNTTGNSNTFLGFNTTASVNNLSNATALGANAIVSQNNTVILGSNADIGIGTSTPSRKLHVSGLTNGIRYSGVATGGSFITVPSATTDKIVFADANGDLRALAAGTTNHVLTMTASGPAWAAASGSSAWALTGNASTNATTNYLGTSDNVDFLIKTSAAERMRFIGNTPQIVINNATPSAASILSVFSATTDDALVLNANGNGRGLLINTAVGTTGDGLEIQKGGTAGSAIDVVISNTNTATGVSVTHSGTGRIANFAQLNPASTTQAVAITNQGPAIVLQVQNGLATSNLPAINVSQVSTQTAATAASVYATSTSSTGGYFTANKSAAATRALQGISNATGNFDVIGVYGEASAVNAGFGYGVVGTGNNFGLYANGDVGASGLKPFQIDHPLDPANKFLKHYSMESPEVLNMYRGSVLLNATGEAEIQLPNYFQAININFTYVLTPVGAPADMYVKTEVDNTGKFSIAGGKPGLKVSWYVYAERNDAYLQEKPWKKEVEVTKKESEKGKYLQPDL
ncbi:MAG: hypothetical protein IPH78_06185 [Bacteroidetes bacterium]|nr:hypothetical protein [Bacteroidota bacterium]